MPSTRSGYGFPFVPPLPPGAPPHLFTFLCPYLEISRSPSSSFSSSTSSSSTSSSLCGVQTLSPRLAEKESSASFLQLSLYPPSSHFDPRLLLASKAMSSLVHPSRFLSGLASVTVWINLCPYLELVAKVRCDFLVFFTVLALETAVGPKVSHASDRGFKCKQRNRP